MTDWLRVWNEIRDSAVVRGDKQIVLIAEAQVKKLEKDNAVRPENRKGQVQEPAAAHHTRANTTAPATQGKGQSLTEDT